ncbi:MAG: glycosyltransferase family 4 protein [Myxococcota bacterium]
MKVGLIIYGDLNTRSGGYLYDRRLIEHLRAAGDTVELIQLPWRSWLQHLTDNISPSLWRRILQMDLDILLQDELNHPSLVLPNTLERLQQQRQWPILSIVHHLRCCEPEHPWWARNLYEAVERAYLATVDGFIFNSHVTRSEVEARTPPRPHVVAWPGGDRLGALAPDDIRPRALRPGPLQLLFIGNITPRKGLHTLLDALSTLPYDLWRLHVVGSTAVAPEYMRRIRSQIAPMRDSITVYGSLPDTDLKRLLRQSHALAVPSSYEGFGIVYMEAAAFGLPAIASTAGAAREIVQTGRSGHLIAPGDSAALAYHLEGWVHDRMMLARMGESARMRFADHPTWAQSTAQIRAFMMEQLE